MAAARPLGNEIPVQEVPTPQFAVSPSSNSVMRFHPQKPKHTPGSEMQLLHKGTLNYGTDERDSAPES